jgi:hypothetical protein
LSEVVPSAPRDLRLPGRLAGDGRLMKTIDFYGLTRAVQDNLLESFRGQFDPKPIVARRGTRPVVAAWLSLSAAATLALTLVCGSGYGKMESALSNHPLPAIVLYVLLAGAIAFGGVQALLFRTRSRELPYQKGVYLFPACLIDARDRYLRVFPLGEASGVSAGSRSVTVRFGPFLFSFEVAADKVATAKERIEQSRAQAKADIPEDDRRKLDPLIPPAVASPLASTVPLTTTPPVWTRFRWVYVGAFGVAVGSAVFFIRDSLSDTRMFETAKARDDVAGYEAYLARGESHRSQVARELLPRAELRLAVAEGSVEAIDAFIAKYPDTDIQEDVRLARRTALVAAFERARAAGTLTSLLDFTERYPKHDLDQYVDEARHVLYVRALNRYRAMMPEQGGEPTAAFVEKLLALAERSGPTKEAGGLRGPRVEVRVRRVDSRDLERADDLVQKNPMYNGVSSLPSRYLDDKHLAPHGEQLAKSLAEALGKAFEPEILTLAPGEPLADSGKDAPKVDKPTLIVSYRVEPSGAAYASKKPVGIFIGAIFIFELEFVIPGDDEPLKVKHGLSQRIPVELLRDVKGQPPRGTLETKLYDAMATEAFGEVEKRYLKQWFKPAPG